MKNDIRLDKAFPNHPKTRKLRRLLGGDGVDCLIALWCFAGEYRTKGRLERLSPDDIAETVGWKGKPEDLINALQAVGFIDDMDGLLILHDWDVHQPFIFNADERSAAAKRAIEKRWRKKSGFVEKQEKKNTERINSVIQNDYDTNTDSINSVLPNLYGTNTGRIQSVLRKACEQYKKSISGGMFSFCEPNCPFFISRNTPYPLPSPYPYPVYIPESFSGNNSKPSDEISSKAKPASKRTAPPVNYEEELPKAMSAFRMIQPQVKNYISMVAGLNKTGKMDQSRQLSILLSLKDLMDKAGDDAIFLGALDVVIEKRIDNLNYLASVIKGKQQKGGSDNGRDKKSNRLPSTPGKYAGIGQTAGAGR